MKHNSIDPTLSQFDECHLHIRQTLYEAPNHDKFSEIEVERDGRTLYYTFANWGIGFDPVLEALFQWLHGIRPMQKSEKRSASPRCCGKLRKRIDESLLRFALFLSHKSSKMVNFYLKRVNAKT